MATCECKDCGHIGIPVWVHNDDKCEKCFSRMVFEILEEETSTHTNKTLVTEGCNDKYAWCKTDDFIKNLHVN